MDSYPHIISIEFRNPLNKHEAKYYGLTSATRKQAVVFINARKNRNRKVLKDTLMHELYHAVVGLFGFSNQHEEAIARKIGKASV